MLDHTCHIKRTAVNNDNIGVFSFFQRTDTVSDANVLSRVDGYGAECLILVHTGFDSEPCAERQVVERSYRRVRDDGNMTSGFCENARCFPGLILNLEFCGMSEGRTYRERRFSFASSSTIIWPSVTCSRVRPTPNSFAIRIAVKISFA